MDARWIPKGQCFFCHADTHSGICNDCKQDLYAGARNRCPVCAVTTVTGKICGQCLLNPPIIDNTIVLTDYAYPFDRYVRTIKYDQKPELIRSVAADLARLIARQEEMLPDIIVPVPLHASRMRQRGFNQASLLARHLGQILGAPVIDTIVVRNRETRSQSGLDHKQRRKNVHDAFTLNNNTDAMRIAICDDVITTGATINELGRLFRDRGCEDIQAWALARTPLY